MLTAAPEDATIQRRGLRRERAAARFDISPSLFDVWVRDGKMPKGHKIGGVVRWDVGQLDAAWDDLLAAESDAPNPFDQVVA